MKYFYVLLCFHISVSFAGRKGQPLPVMNQFNNAEIIVLVQVMEKEEKAPQSTLEILRVYKGESTLKGSKIKITGKVFTPKAVRRSSAISPGPNYFESSGTHYVIILDKNWRDNSLPVQQKFLPYDKEVKEALKLLEMPEKERLLELQKKAFNSTNSFKNMISAFMAMKNPDNLIIMLNFYDKIPDKFKVKAKANISEAWQSMELVYISNLAQTYDIKVVPKLIDIFKSSESSYIKRQVMDALVFKYPGAPGVTELILNENKNGSLTHAGQEYLALRFKDLKFQEPKKNDFAKLKELLNKGDKKSASEIYIKLIKEGQNNLYGFYANTLEFLKIADVAGKSAIKEVLLEQCKKDVISPESHYTKMAVKAMRLMKDHSFIEPLVNLSKRTDLIFISSSHEAVATLYELDEKSRRNAFDLMLKDLPQIKFQYESLPYILGIWLLYDGSRQLTLPEKYESEWQELEPFLKIKFEAGIKPALLSMLKSEKFSRRVTFLEWVYYFCGQLKVKESIPIIIERVMDKEESNLDEKMVAALGEIGGIEAEQGLEKIMSKTGSQFNTNSIKPKATVALLNIVDEQKIRPLLMRSLEDINFGSRKEFLVKMGQIGTPEDLPVLLKECDFWTADKKNSYWAFNAVIAIRTRHGYDLNGKVVKQ